MKSCVVERFNRTLKGKMWKYLTPVKSRRYVNVIQDLVQSYNQSSHRSIKMAPAEVDKDNKKIVFNTLYKLKPQKMVNFKFSVGDTVRISKLRGIFRKGYQLTDEFFTIKERLGRYPPVYKLEDLAGDMVKGVFYKPEI